MVNVTKKQIVLVAIFVFAFAYRIMLLFGQTYPPGSDIGFHASVINSITQGGNTNFLLNFYQMGGELELEFPGFHIVVAQVMLLTGMSSFVAQALVAALFSSFTVLAVFLVTRIAWNESAAFIAALFVSLSPTDIDIICWGGYPNIIVLFLVPVVFYLFLKKDKISQMPFFVSASLLAASIFLTHSLSAAVFIGITIVTLLCVLIFPRVFNETRKNVLNLALPIVVGLILVSPFLVSAIPIYLRESSLLTGSAAIAQTLVVNRTIPIELTLALFVGIVAFFLLSKKIKERFFSFPVFLFISWLLIPALLTQGYMFGFYMDAVRFQFFFIYPVIILFAVIGDSASRYFSAVLDVRWSWKRWSLSSLESKIPAKIEHKKVYSVFLVVFLLVLLFGIPIFSFPWEGARVQAFYQVMDEEGYRGIEWAKQNTPANAMFASDMSYGWWMAGFGQRPTISNIDLAAITLTREVSISRNVSYLLDTDYMIDNGYIQVREDGGYLNRHNPLFLANLNWTVAPYGFFQFNSSQITLRYHNENGSQLVNSADLSVTDMRLAYVDTDNSAIIISRANSDISYVEIVTVTKASPFANMTIALQSNKASVWLDRLDLVVDAPGAILQQPSNATLAILDQEAKVCGQLIFAQSTPATTNLCLQNPCTTQLTYNLQDKSKGEIQILLGMFPISDSELQNSTATSDLRQMLSANLQNPPTAPELPITTFDYKTALQQYNVSYLVNCNFELNPKYANDPEFSLAFINNKIAIFNVKANTPKDS
ncbi:hypothetical protein [Candidatus Bathycorpusculum sp.]|uniref:hypothetical protein n=1 Tax=Candidatus Bathycorpusculum sp. TaxID=2994959 RepID=UPI002828BDC0|nr:dolichyl-diphosphooligosaccharide--protein glycosyltransferase subunit STT3 [Candidatus Termitimicrobium sp.]MCL2431801.1 dolichyl-diphosphooligosaccharide--protein glycosyltransferase subunit STT3 [Candidatus Termitimicrobium sp.]